MKNDSRGSRAFRIEAALWIVMGTLAFLAKDNPRLEYPQALLLFAGLLLSSLATSLAVRLAPQRAGVHALTLLAGYASIAGLQSGSGGTESTLWVLYLLPLFTAAILLEGRETFWVAAGACASNATLYAVSPDPWGAGHAFELTLKTGVLAVAAVAVWALSRSERDAEARVQRQRNDIARLESIVQETQIDRERERGLAEIAADGAGVIHDLNTPLMVVRGYARLHIERGTGDAALDKDLARMESAAVFCQELTARILARDAAPETERRAVLIAESALGLAEPVLMPRGITVRRAYSEESLWVKATARELERILLNLLANAGKSMTEGGTLTLGVARDDSAGRAEVVFTVEDEGLGISPDILPRLFQPFATTRAGKGGTGLGLYLSRESARRMGGTLDAENRPEGGARFILRLPLASVPETAPA